MGVLSTTPAIFQPHGLSLQSGETEGRGKEDFRGDIQALRKKKKRFIDRAIEKEKIFFFSKYPRDVLEKSRPSIDRKSIEIFRAPVYNRFLGQMWDYAESAARVYARMHASSGRAWHS